MSGIAISQCICVCVCGKKHAIHLVMFPSFQVNTKKKIQCIAIVSMYLKEQNTSGRQQNPKTNRVELKAILTTPARKKCGTQF